LVADVGSSIFDDPIAQIRASVIGDGQQRAFRPVLWPGWYIGGWSR
jgi:hypothetical protein